MKRFQSAVIIITLFSCSSSVEKDNTPSTDNQDNSPIENTINVQNEIYDIDWSNPVFINGSSFGNIINTYFKIGDFEMLYKLTDQSSKGKFSKQEIIDRYKILPLGFVLKLNNKTIAQKVIWLHYSVKIDATNKVLRIPITIENDTCRIILDKFEKEISLISK